MTKDMIKQANDILLRNGDSQIPNSDEELFEKVRQFYAMAPETGIVEVLNITVMHILWKFCFLKELQLHRFTNMTKYWMKSTGMATTNHVIEF